MEFLDDEAEVSSQDDDVILPTSRRLLNRRARKRARTSRGSHHSASEDTTGRSSDYTLPPNSVEAEDSDVELDELRHKKSKYGDVVHIPEHQGPHKESFVSQLSQPWSSPSHIRGARWKKPRTPEPPPAAAAAVAASPSPVAPVVVPVAPVAPPAGPVEKSKEAKKSSVTPRTQVHPPPESGNVSPQSFDEFDDDDPILLEALLAPVIDNPPPPPTTRLSTEMANADSGSLRQTTLFGINTTQREARACQSTRTHNWPLANRSEKPTHHSINLEAMKTWVYPTNLGRIRDYQYNIVHKGLFHNLLVALPTGLGKTFIAATVMLNWFRWTKDAQLVFVAPTRPLVVQQAQACYGIAGIPKTDTTIMTGGVPSSLRAVEWQEKRVFFMTPQTFENDLKSGIADAKRIVLLVVDEAHKATGEYSYVKVVRLLRQLTESFRVLALTATPGSKVESVQNVIDSLGIARVEIRTEDSIDIREFVHSRDTQLRMFDPSEELAMTLELFDQAVTPVLSQLVSQGAYHERRPSNMNLYSLKMARDRWAQSAAANVAEMGLKMKIRRIFEVLMSLAHSIDLLKFHGIGPFYHKMTSFEKEAGSGKYIKMILDNDHFKKMMNYMRSWTNNPDFEGHPKLTYLKEVVLNHFLDAGERSNRAAENDGGAASTAPETRIMVFAHYRESAEQIQRLLKRHEPLIRSHVFVGQSSTKGSGGMNQKTQLEIVEKFKSGVYNTLVATSIGEEGLDIGEVDLIVCYDSSSSPIRMLQRMGRTGRKRAGRIEVLLMRGKEENNFYKAKDNYQKMQDIIESGTEFSFRDDQSPRIVPKEIQPAVDKRIMDIPVENTQPGLPEPGKGKGRVQKVKKPPKRFHMPDGVATGFAFLGDGDGKTKKKKQSRRQGGSNRPVLDTVIAAVPSLERVLMTPEQEQRFDNQYRQVSGNEPQYIQVVRFDAFPESQKKLQKTCLIGHSRYTKIITSTIQKMNEPERDWRRPTEEEIMHTQTFGTKPVAERTERDGNRNHRSNDKSGNAGKACKTSSTSSGGSGGVGDTTTLNSPLSHGHQVVSVCESDYDKDSFIDDDADDGITRDTHRHPVSSFTSPPTVDEHERPWYVPVGQNSIQDVLDSDDDDDDDDDELPGFGEIIGEVVSSSAKRKSVTTMIRTTAAARRRVIASDNDDDDNNDDDEP